MRVINVIDGKGWTGGVEQTMLLAGELRRCGIEAEIACHRDNPVRTEAPTRDIPVRVYDRGGGRMSRFGALKGILREGWDVAIGHKPASIRHLIAPVYTGRGRPLFIGVRRVSYPVSPLTVYRAVDHVVAVSASVRAVLTASGLKVRDVTVIPSGVETERFRFDGNLRHQVREELGLSGKKIVLNLAKFVPGQKGQEILFQSLATMRERCGIRLLLAGPETDGDEAAGLVRQYGLERTVRLLGFRRDMPRLICAADLFVFPSLPGLDAIAGSVLQAMACERVVVSSRVGGIPEYVADGWNGYLVEPGDPAGLAAKIRMGLALSEEEKAITGRRARETVLAGYSTTFMARRYAALLERLVGERSAKKKGRRR